MKKICLQLFAVLSCFILGVILVGKNTNAAISFDPTSPQDTGAVISVSCDTGDYISQFSALDGSAIYLSQPCPFINMFSGAPGDSYIITECDSSVAGSTCDTALQPLSVAEADPGFISEAQFDFNAAAAVAPGELPYISQFTYDLLFGTFNIVLILSFMFLFAKWAVSVLKDFFS